MSHRKRDWVSTTWRNTFKKSTGGSLEIPWEGLQTFKPSDSGVTIRVTYRGSDTRWSQSADQKLRALLYFEFEYPDLYSDNLNSATTRIDFGSNLDGSLVKSVTGWAPHVAFTGEPLDEHEETSRSINPSFEIGAAPIGTVAASGFTSQDCNSRDVKTAWSFKAGIDSEESDPRATRATSRFERTSKHNRTCLQRPFLGAFSVCFQGNTPIKFKVSVDAMTWTTRPRRVFLPRNEPMSLSIRPCNEFLTPDEFDAKVKSLETAIHEYNRGLAPWVVPDTQHSAAAPASGSTDSVSHPSLQHVYSGNTSILAPLVTSNPPSLVLSTVSGDTN